MKYFFLCASFLFFNSVVYSQTQVGDITIPNAMVVQGKSLALNGAGIREKFWINLYVAGLYLENKSSDAQEISASKSPMAIKLHIVSGLVSTDKMMKSLRKGFEKATHGNVEPLKDEIETLTGFMQEEIEKGDVFDLVYIPSKGMVAYKNGEEKGIVKGHAFKKALFGIWLSNNPADESLKEALLGKD